MLDQEFDIQTTTTNKQIKSLTCASEKTLTHCTAKTSPSSISHWDSGGGVESNNSQNESDVCEDDIINDNLHHLPQNSTHTHDFCALLLP